MAKGIYKRGSRYEGRFQINGKRYCITGKTIREVTKQMNDKRYEIEHGMVDTVKKITVDKWFYMWIDEYKKPYICDRTIQIYLSCYRLYIHKFIGDMLLEDVRNVHIQKMFNELAAVNKLSAGTLKNIKKPVYGMFEQAVINDMLYKNPTKGLKIPKTQQKNVNKANVLTTEEQKKLESITDDYYHNIVILGLYTGLRIAEITGLQWSDIDYKNNIIKVRRNLNHYSSTGFYIGDTKTKTSKRDVPMTQNVVKLLKEQKKSQLEKRLLLGDKLAEHETIKDLVFTSPTGAPIYQQLFNRALEKMCLQAGIERITPHGLRHTFATRSIEKGMQPQTLKSIMGHSSLSITMDLYAHVLNDTKQLEIKVLEQI